MAGLKLTICIFNLERGSGPMHLNAILPSISLDMSTNICGSQGLGLSHYGF